MMKRWTIWLMLLVLGTSMPTWVVADDDDRADDQRPLLTFPYFTDFEKPAHKKSVPDDHDAREADDADYARPNPMRDWRVTGLWQISKDRSARTSFSGVRHLDNNPKDIIVKRNPKTPPKTHIAGLKRNIAIPSTSVYPVLSFWHRLNLNPGETAVVQIRYRVVADRKKDREWFTIREYDASDNVPDYQRQVFALGAYKGGAIRVRFVHTDASGTAAVWLIDDVLLGEAEDADNDGIPDLLDPDRDGDGISNADEIRLGTNPDDAGSVPADLDRDGIPDALDTDRDGDGTLNTADAFPNDATEWRDLDGDGIGDNADPDNDGDGINDRYETQLGTNPDDATSVPSDADRDGIPDVLDTDRDGDGVADIDDAFPDDPAESSDLDRDGIGNNADPDRDGDGISNAYETQLGTDPNNAASVPPDFDRDGIPDSVDDDRDGDGVRNTADVFPDNPAESADLDGDGVGNNSDPDRDGDGINNVYELDAGTDPNNPDSIPPDIDADGIPDVLDGDMDGDGVANEIDAFPRDTAEAFDLDGDGTGDNADTDRDGDGISNAFEMQLGFDPSNAGSTPPDRDRDGTPDTLDSDRDGDGVANDTDAFPDDARYASDQDADGVADELDQCPGTATRDSVNADGCSLKQLDKTPPTITVTLAPLPNAAGWNNAYVTVTFTCDDGTGSGVAQCPPTALLAIEGAQQSLTVNAIDAAGNTGSLTVLVSVDKTAPSVAITDPASNTTLSTNPPVLAFTLSDLSGVDPAQLSLTVGGSVVASHCTLSGNTGTCTPNGPFTGASVEVTIVATDRAGNSGSAHARYILDSDGDGVPDSQDPFLTDAKEWSDLDGDQIGDNADPDRDGDGISNDYEQQLGTDPSNAGSVPTDMDRDGVPDGLDNDRDGDGVANDKDTYPDDATRQRLDPITSLSAALVGEHVSLTWTAHPDRSRLGGYLLYRGTPGAIPHVVAELEADVTNYTDNTVTNGTGYEYQLRAVDARKNEGAAGNTVPLFVAYNTTAVTGLKVIREGESARLTWDNVGTESYQIYRGEGGATPAGVATATSSSHLDTDTRWHTVYGYQIAMLMRFTDPFSNVAVAIPGPVTPIVVLDAVPQIAMTFLDAKRIDATTWEQEVHGDTVAVSGRVSALLSVATIKAAQGTVVRSTQTTQGEFRLVLPAIAGAAWNIIVTETQFADRSVHATLALVSDTVAPSVTISGAAQRSVNSDRVTLNGTVQDDRGTIASTTATNSRYAAQTFGVTQGAQGSFTTELPLAIGDNVITIRAVDSSSNAAQATVTIARPAPMLPSVRIDAPAPGSTVTTARVNVSGIVYSGLSAEQIRLRLGSAEQIAAASNVPGVYPFTFANVPRQKGSNALTVVASTPVGETEARVVVTYQTETPAKAQPPTISLHPALLTGVVNTAIVPIRGTVTAAAGLSQLLINGEATGFTVLQSTTYSFNHAFNFGAVPGDEVSLSIVATDALGQTTIEVLTLRRDNVPPQIVVNSPVLQPLPTVNAIVELPLKLTGEIRDANLAGVSLNGESMGVEPISEGVYRFTVSVNLMNGAIEALQLKAWDTASNASLWERDIRVNAPVVIDVITPKQGETVRVSAQERTIDVTVRLVGLLASHTAETVVGNGVPTSMNISGNVANGAVVLPIADGDVDVDVVVKGSDGVIAAKRSIRLHVVNVDAIPLAIERVQPARDAQNVEPDEPIALYFNKPIDASKLAVTVRETVHGRTWDLSGQDGTSPLTAPNRAKLVEVHRDQRVVTGKIAVFPGNTVLSFHPERDFAYGATIAIEVAYQNESLWRGLYHVRPLPTFVHGVVFDQLQQPVAGLEVALLELGRTTTTDENGNFTFGFGEGVARAIPGGRHRLIINQGLKNRAFGTQSSWIALQEGELNRLGTVRVPLLNPGVPFRHIESGASQVALASGDLMLDLSQVKLVFPDGALSGDAHVQFTQAQHLGVTVFKGAMPNWVFAVQPAGIKVHGQINFSIAMPSLYGARDYIPKVGTRVVLVGMDETAGQLVPVGVGRVDANQRVVNDGVLALSDLSFIGYALVHPDAQTVLEHYALGKITLNEVINALNAWVPSP